MNGHQIDMCLELQIKEIELRIQNTFTILSSIVNVIEGVYMVI